MNASPEIIRSLRGQLLAAGDGAKAGRSGVRTNVPLLDAFASVNENGLARGAIHEVLADVSQGTSIDAFALLLASAVAASREGGWIVWSDPERTLYPPALQRSGVAIERLLLLRPRSPQDELWALAECMRCGGVAATVAHVGRLTPVQARRLQLAAEQGGGVGVLVRPEDKRSANYAAATRWRVTSAAADAAEQVGRELAQRWQVELAYGHGRHVGQRFVLEVDRETGRTVAVPERTRPAAVACAEDSVHRVAGLAIGPRAAETRRSSA